MAIGNDLLLSEAHAIRFFPFDLSIKLNLASFNPNCPNYKALLPLKVQDIEGRNHVPAAQASRIAYPLLAISVG